MKRASHPAVLVTTLMHLSLCLAPPAPRKKPTPAAAAARPGPSDSMESGVEVGTDRLSSSSCSEGLPIASASAAGYVI